MSNENDRYYIPQNIYRGYTIGPFRLSGIIEGLILGFLGYQLVGLLPLPYAAVKITFEIVVALGLFLLAAKGLFNYSLTEYVIIVLKYFFTKKDREFRRAFRLSKATDKTTEGYAQGMVIEKEFGDGVVRLKDGRYVALIVVSPVNFFTKTPREQQVIVEAMQSKLRSMPVKGQFVSYTDSSNPFEYIDFVKACQKDSPYGELLQREYDDYYKLCRSGIGYGTVKQNFMVVFSSDALDQFYHTEQERIYALQRCSRTFKQFLDGLSNVDNSDKTTSPKQYKRQMSKRLFDVYNPTATSLNGRAFDDRQEKVISTFKNFDKNVKTEEIPESYFLAPMGFDDSASSRYVVVGDSYYSFFYIAQNTYPIGGITPGWIAQQYQHQGIEYHLFYQAITDDAYINKLNRAANLTRGLSEVSNKESVLKSEIESVLDASSYMKARLERQDQPYYMGVMISLHSNQISQLYAMEDSLARRMREQGVSIVPCRFLEKEAYISTRLGNKVHPKLWKKMKQNVPASALSAMFPFASTSISDRDGIYLGNSNGTPVFINLWDTTNHDNANLSITGSAGKGKTFTLMLLALRNRLLGREIFIIAPIKGYEFDGLVKALHGNVIRINSTSGNTINIMELYPHLKEEEQDTSLLYRKVESVKAFIAFKKPDMTAVEQQILDKCIIDTYARFGITKDNDSIWADKENRIKKNMPILGDLVATVDEYAKHDPAASELSTVMHVYTEGSLSFFNAQTNIDLTKGITSFDLSGLSAGTKTIAMFATTELIQSYMEEDRSIFKMLIVDEIWMLLENEGSSEVVVEWSKTIRGRGGSLCIATQELADLSRTKRGATLITQSETRILLGMRNEDLNYADEMLNLTEPVKRLILDSKRGNGVLITRDATVGISMMGSGHNIFTFTTDPNLTKIRESIKDPQEQRFVESLMEEGESAFDIKRELEKYRQSKAHEAVSEKTNEEQTTMTEVETLVEQYVPKTNDIEDRPPRRAEKVSEEPKGPPRRVISNDESKPPKRVWKDKPPRRVVDDSKPPKRPIGPPRRKVEEPKGPPRRSRNKEE